MSVIWFIKIQTYSISSNVSLHVFLKELVTESILIHISSRFSERIGDRKYFDSLPSLSHKQISILIPAHHYFKHFLVRYIFWELLTFSLLTECQQHSAKNKKKNVYKNSILSFKCILQIILETTKYMSTSELWSY